MKILLVGVVRRFDVVGGVNDRSVIDISNEWLIFFIIHTLWIIFLSVQYFVYCLFTKYTSKNKTKKSMTAHINQA